MTKYPILNDKEWVREQIAKLSLRTIAKNIGCSYSAVVHAVRKFKLDVPWKPPVFPDDMRERIQWGIDRRYPNGRFGEDAARWKGGRRKTHGYVRVYAPNHPNCTQDGYVMEHRLVMEQHLNRLLADDEEIHHKNHVRDDNRIENLEILSHQQHRALHASIAKTKAKLERLENKLNDESSQGLDDHGISH